MSSVEFVVVEEPEPRGCRRSTPRWSARSCWSSSSAASSRSDRPAASTSPASRLRTRSSSMALIYALGGTSGAHFNPAVTARCGRSRRSRPRTRSRTSSASASAAMLGGLVVLLLFNDVGDAVNYGAATINGEVLQDGSAWLGLIAEALGTFMLMWAIMGVAVNPRGEAALARPRHRRRARRRGDGLRPRHRRRPEPRALARPGGRLRRVRRLLGLHRRPARSARSPRRSRTARSCSTRAGCRRSARRTSCPAESRAQ